MFKREASKSPMHKVFTLYLRNKMQIQILTIKFSIRFFKSLVAIAIFLLIVKNASAGSDPDTVVNAQPFAFSFDTLPGLVSDADQLRAGLLYDAERSKIVWQKNMDDAYPIASLTKMMVGLLAIEDVEAGCVSLSDEIVVTRTFRKKIRRRKFKNYTAEEHFTLEGMLKLAMVASNNESTIWIARHCSGDQEVFIQRMNQRARELGMTKTLYNNPSGLPAGAGLADNCASVHDLLLLSLEILKHPRLMEITNIDYARVSNGKGAYAIHNHNGLVINYNNEVDGIKTGYTKAARFCLVASAHRGDHRLISVALGVRSPWVRNGIVANMMNEYYDAIRLGRLGESAIDYEGSKWFLDSLNKGWAVIHPMVEPKHLDQSDESYAYTYKTVSSKIKTLHVVRSGDNLSKIADRYNVGMGDLKKWNRLRSSRVMKGQKLLVYKTITKRIPVKLVVDPNEDCTENCPDELDTTNITPGLSEIRRSNIDSKAEQKSMVHQDVDNDDTINVVSGNISSQKLIYHTVQPGDTLWNIAQRYQSNMAEIKKINRITNGKLLKAGTRIKVPVNT